MKLKESSVLVTAGLVVLALIALMLAPAAIALIGVAFEAVMRHKAIRPPVEGARSVTFGSDDPVAVQNR